MKDDMISRQAALYALGERPVVWSDNDDYTLGERNQYDMDRLAIETVPSAQTGWIPVTERLPEESGEYLCTIYRAIPPYHMFHPEDDVYVKTVEVKEYRASGGFPNCVKAWQPKPKPWEGEKDDG